MKPKELDACHLFTLSISSGFLFGSSEPLFCIGLSGDIYLQIFAVRGKMCQHQRRAAAVRVGSSAMMGDAKLNAESPSSRSLSGNFCKLFDVLFVLKKAEVTFKDNTCLKL